MSYAQKHPALDQAWKKIETLASQGKYRTAVRSLQTFYQQAQRANHITYQVKAALNIMATRERIDEDDHNTNLKLIDSLIAHSTAPAKQIFLLEKGKRLKAFLEEAIWNREESSSSTEVLPDDIETWSLQQIEQAYLEAFALAVEPVIALQEIRLTTISELINPGENALDLRPTLLDLIAHEVIAQLSEKPTYSNQPDVKFLINDPAFLGTSAAFLSRPIAVTKPFEANAILIATWQSLLHAHRNSAPEVQQDADQWRLQTIFDAHSAPNKQELYISTLQQYIEENQGKPTQANWQALLVRQYLNQVAVSSDPTAKSRLQRQAHTVASEGAKQFPQLNGGKSCAMLLQEIETKTFHFQAEQVELPHQPFRLLANYQNVEQVFMRVIRWNSKHQEAIYNKTSDEQWSYLRNLKPIRIWSEQLPQTNDFLAHAVELKVDGLAVGQYMLLFSYRSDFSVKQNILGNLRMDVSNLGIVKQQTNNFLVMHRSSGLPVANARVEVWEKAPRYYNQTKSNQKLGERITTSDGSFEWQSQERNQEIDFRVFSENDSLLLDEPVYIYSTSDQLNTTTQRRSIFLMDRAIYRPGQIIFFKGILTEYESDLASNRLCMQRKGTVTLRDVNRQEIARLDYTTNSFGSYQGSFKLPETGLTGAFTLEDSHGPSFESFRVEAYKRPKFYADLQAPKQAYQLMDSLAITGVAKAYAGQPIGSARVRYQVHRTTETPSWWRWWGPRQGARTQVAFGETTTQKDGTFEVRFQALPDLTADPQGQPRFLFEVSVDVIDIQGETQSKSITIPAAYQNVFLAWVGPKQFRTNTPIPLTLNATTIQEDPVQQQVRVRYTPLQAPKGFVRKRYWETPDKFLYSEAQFRQWFPNDEFNTETDPKTWPEGSAAAEFDATIEQGKMAWPAERNLAPGWYKFVATGVDVKGQAIRAETQVEILQADGRSVWQAEPLEMKMAIITAQPGDQVQVSLFTKSPTLYLIHQANNRKESSVEKLYIKAGKAYQINDTIQESDRGNRQHAWGYLWNNRVYNITKTIQVPWSNKSLQLNLDTHRDFTLPGSEETWSLQVTDHQANPADAELAATLYDASLDQFTVHAWDDLFPWPTNYTQHSLKGIGFEAHTANLHHTITQSDIELDELAYPSLQTNMVIYERMAPPPPSVEQMKFAAPRILADQEMSAAVVDSASVLDFVNALEGKVAGVQVTEVVTIGSRQTPRNKSNENRSGDNQPRRDFRETAFFKPQLRTDSNGRIQFSFRMPEALTRWKGLFVAHDASLASGASSTQITTRKLWMVQANLPRFLREGDQMEIPVKVSNLDSIAITGTVSLELIDARTQKPIDGWLKNVFPNQYASVDAGQSTVIKFPIEIPYGLEGGLLIRAFARAEKHTDGEEHLIPILPNRLLITESLPLQNNGNETKSYTFRRLLESADRPTLNHRGLTIQYTANPVWYAVQSLPYLMEYPWECVEQTFNRYFANQLAAHLTQSIPGLQRMFERWKQSDSTALKSALASNQALKQTLLQETPWVLEAQSQEEQYKRISLLFDLQRMTSETNRIIERLQEAQSEEGWFSWFQGGYPDLRMTTYILKGIGQLKKLNALDEAAWTKLAPIQEAALNWVDQQWVDAYKKTVKAKKTKSSLPDTDALDYLYMRSFFPEAKSSELTTTATRYWKQQWLPMWLKLDLPDQARLAIVLHREGKRTQAASILAALDDQRIRTKELGSYWKTLANGGYAWNEAPIENHALMIEAFREVTGKHQTALAELKTWLLLQKQTQHWESTKATAAACYALLWQETQTLSTTPSIAIQLGKSLTVKSPKQQEAGTGTWEQVLPAHAVEPEMGAIQLTVQGAQANQVGWGAIHWQYYEQLDQIKSNAGSAIQLIRKLFREVQTSSGTRIEPISDSTTLQVGDKLVVQVQLRLDRAMEYVHLKDMRAANLEPVEMLSAYQYRNGLGFYQAPSDASMNFFFGNLPKGTHTLEYRLTVQQAGNSSMGISTIQCMYAPQYNSHSPGVRLNISAND
jgi:hypothetical protein